MQRGIMIGGISMSRLATHSLVSLLSLFGGLALAQSSEPLQVDIAAQPVGDALNQFAEQSGLQVVLYADDATGIHVAGVSGQFDDVTVALESLLASTGLEYSFINDRTLAVTPATHAADERGDSEAGNGRKAALNPGLTGQAKRSVEQDQTSRRAETERSKDEKERPLEEIVVTGTKIRGGSLASPVRTLEQEDIALSGAATVGELLDTLPQNFGGGINEDAFAAANASLSQVTGKSTVNLRGLGAGATLVLLNGRRFASNGFDEQVDVSMIPVSAVERVEVLTDGASAIYGSDAIAGVVNFIMRRDYEGAESRLRFGTLTDGGMTEYRAVQSIGKNWGETNLFASYQYYDRGDLQARDREQTAGIAVEDASNRELIDIFPEQQSHSVLASATHNFSEEFSLQGDLLFSTRRARYDLVFSPSFLIPIDSKIKNNQYAGTLAAFYEISDDWDFEVAGAFSSNTSRTLSSNLETGDLVQEIRQDTELWSAESMVTGSLFELPAGSVDIAIGGQYREESNSFDFGGGDPPSLKAWL